jgi:16S rRNA (guanine966-N2)-methyltransferase
LDKLFIILVYKVGIKVRVIAGTCKGRPLRTVKGVNTRPTTDKVKESMFNIIGPFFDGGIGLDLFAGSGGLGIEALSRGLDRMIFVDRDSKAIDTIKYNVDQCAFSDRAEIFRNDANRALKAVIKRDVRLNLLFFDPPYAKETLKALIETVEAAKLLHHDGWIVAEHTPEIALPDQIGLLIKTKTEQYGSTIAVSIYQYLQ